MVQLIIYLADFRLMNGGFYDIIGSQKKEVKDMARGQMICGRVISINSKGCFVDVDCATENYIAFFGGHASIGDRVLLCITKVLDSGVLRCELHSNLNGDLLCA